MRGDSTHQYQKIGLFMLVVGATLMIWDPNAERVKKTLEGEVPV